MTEKISTERVEEIVLLADAATAGPWYSDDEDAPPGDVSLWFGGPGAWKGDIVVNLGGTIVEVGHACPNEIANARFIAAAREALPSLAQEVLELRKTLEIAEQRAISAEALCHDYADVRSTLVEVAKSLLNLVNDLDYSTEPVDGHTLKILYALRSIYALTDLPS